MKSKIKTYLSSKGAVFLFVILTSATGAAGVHAYTQNLRVNHLMLDLIYWAEVGWDYAGILLG